MPSQLQNLSCTCTHNHSTTLCDHELERCCPLDHGRHRLSPTASLGEFNKLPSEILWIIFSNLDISSLYKFRRVNQRAMMVIDSVPEYTDLITFAPNSIRGSFKTETADCITCKQLHRAVRKTLCEHMWGERKCNREGQLVCLETVERRCFLCAAAFSLRNKRYHVQLEHAPFDICWARWSTLCL